MVCPFLFDRVYKTQNRPDKALDQCERSLQLLKDRGQPQRMISVYRDMAAVERDRGRSDRAVEHLSKASDPHHHHHNHTHQNSEAVLRLTPFVLRVRCRLMPSP